MALIQCPECGKEVSSKAAACPHCGNPMVKEVPVQVEMRTNESNSNAAGYYRIFGWILWIGGLILAFLACDSNGWVFLIIFLVFLVAGFTAFVISELLENIAAIRTALESIRFIRMNPQQAYEHESTSGKVDPDEMVYTKSERAQAAAEHESTSGKVDQADMSERAKAAAVEDFKRARAAALKDFKQTYPDLTVKSVNIQTIKPDGYMIIIYSSDVDGNPKTIRYVTDKDGNILSSYIK